MAYAIIETPVYYQGTCAAKQENFLKKWVLDPEQNLNADGAFDRFETEDREEAQEIVRRLDSGTYYLSHGEAGRPSYEILDLDDSFRPDCYEAAGLRGFGEEIDEIDIPKDLREEFENCNVEYHRSNDDYDVYTYQAETENHRYTVAYCPRTLAIELAGDDLGNIDWDHECYYREEI